MKKTNCENCGKELEVMEEPCSSCGYSKKEEEKKTSGSLSFETSLGYKHIKAGKEKPVLEGKHRHKVSKDPELKGQRVIEDLVIDKKEKRKRHKVEDEETGEICHEEDEPL